MGMFDWVKVEVPLPDGWTGSRMQTKAFGNYLTTIRIGADGRLYERKAEIAVHEPAEGAPGWAWEEKELNHWWEDLNFHGYFHFYGYEYSPNESTGSVSMRIWHDYRAKFTDGNLVEITCEAEE